MFFYESTRYGGLASLVAMARVRQANLKHCNDAYTVMDSTLFYAAASRECLSPGVTKGTCLSPLH